MEQKSYFGDRGLLFDPVVIVRDVARKWFLILVLAVFVGVAVFIYTDWRYTPVYESSAILVITTHSSYSTVYDNIDSASSLASVFSEILNSSVMKKRILEVMEIPSFSGSISASCVDATNLLLLKVQSDDPRTSFQAIRALIENHHIVTYDVIGDISVEVLQHPTVATAPVNSSNAMDAMKRTAVLAAIGAGVLLAVMSATANTVRSQAEAEKKLDCWCLGEILHEKKRRSLGDRLRRKKTGILVTMPATSFGYVSTMNRISRRILRRMEEGRVLAVTSVAENEGKTTVSTNLALTMAQKHRKVLLIDCDLRKPACHTVMDVKKPKHCINDVAQGKMPLHKAVNLDKLSGLHVLYARKVAASAADGILNAEGMEALIRQAREEYDAVVIDLPPMSVCADAEYIAGLADAVLLVVRQNGVAVPELNHAVSVLEGTGAHLLGCVLNNVHTSFLTSAEAYGSRKYGYHDKYGKYGYYDAYASERSV